MTTFQIHWKDRGGFPGGLAETFEAQNQIEAIRAYKMRAPSLMNRNINLRLGHCGVCLKTSDGRQIGRVIARGM